jgi:hypothetical protein
MLSPLSWRGRLSSLWYCRRAESCHKKADAGLGVPGRERQQQEKKRVNAHELAKQLLAGPDIPVMGLCPTADQPLWLEKIGKAIHDSSVDNEELDGSEEKPVTQSVIVLVLHEDDGYFVGVPF